MDAQQVVNMNKEFFLENGFSIPLEESGKILFHRGALDYLVLNDPYLHVRNIVRLGCVTIYQSIGQIEWKNHTFLQESAAGFFKICNNIEDILNNIESGWRFIESESILYWAIDNNFHIEILPGENLVTTMKCVNSPNIWHVTFLPNGTLTDLSGSLGVGNYLENTFSTTKLNIVMNDLSYTDPLRFWADVKEEVVRTLQERAEEVDFSQK